MGTTGVPNPAVFDPNYIPPTPPQIYTTTHNPGLTRTTASLTSLMLKTFPQLMNGRGNGAVRFNPYGIEPGQQQQPPQTRSLSTTRLISKSSKSKATKPLAVWGSQQMQFPQALVMMGMCATQYALRRSTLRPKSLPRTAHHTSRQYPQRDGMGDGNGSGDGKDGVGVVQPRKKLNLTRDPIPSTNDSVMGSTNGTTLSVAGSSVKRNGKGGDGIDSTITTSDLSWPQSNLSRHEAHVNQTLTQAQAQGAFATTMGQIMSTMPSTIPITLESIHTQSQPEPYSREVGGVGTGGHGTGIKSTSKDKATAQFFSPHQPYNPPLDQIPTISPSMGSRNVSTIVQQRNLFIQMASVRNCEPLPPPPMLSPALSLPFSMDQLDDVAEDYSIQYQGGR